MNFDAYLRDPASPLLPAYDASDHINPSVANYETMAACVNIKCFLC